MKSLVESLKSSKKSSYFEEKKKYNFEKDDKSDEKDTDVGEMDSDDNENIEESYGSKWSFLPKIDDSEHNERYSKALTKNVKAYLPNQLKKHVSLVSKRDVDFGSGFSRVLTLSLTEGTLSGASFKKMEDIEILSDILPILSKDLDKYVEAIRKIVIDTVEETR